MLSHPNRDAIRELRNPGSFGAEALFAARGGEWTAVQVSDVLRRADARRRPAAMNDEQFKAIRGLLLTIVILLGLIAGILLSLAWEYL